MADEEEIDETGAENHDRMSAQETAFLKKYYTLRKKCEQMQQANEKLVNRLQHVKKIIKRYKKERRFLVNRLDEYGDNYGETQVPVMWEEDQLYNFLKPPPPYPEPPVSEENSQDPLTTPSGAFSQGMGIESLSMVHPILSGLGSGDNATALPSMSPLSQPKAKRLKTEKDKDPNAPKKPANAFLMFCQQQRNTVLEDHHKESAAQDGEAKELSHQELTRRLAHRWKALNTEQKKIYYEMYEREKERYDRELKEYTAKEMISVKIEEDVNVTDTPVDMTIELIKTEPF